MLSSSAALAVKGIVLAVIAGAAILASASPTPVAGTPRLPLLFEPNRGQTDPAVQYLARTGAYNFFLTGTEAVLQPRHGAPVRLHFDHANPSPASEALDHLPGRSHYFTGTDAQRGHTDISQYGRVRYRDVYPGMDFVFYGHAGEIEYDILLQPGADASRLQFSFTGADALRIDPQSGDLLLLRSGEQTIRQRRPVVYQEAESGHRVTIESHYVVKPGHRVQIALAPYDHSRPLVIDPVLAYSTYLGGSGTDAVSSVVVDSAGNLYVAGTTTSLDFPTTSAAYRPTANNAATAGTNYQVFVAKLNPAGNALLYATYLGPGEGIGTGARVFLAIDSQGNAYITGCTSTMNQFPTTTGAYAPANNGTFVSKLSPDGSSLLYYTGIDQAGAVPRGIAVDAQGRAYIAGYTNGPFPTIPPTPLLATGSAFVASVSANGRSLTYALPFGGSGYSFAMGIAVNATGQATVAGSTNSIDFPTTAQAFQRTLKGDDDAFVLRLNPTGTAVVFSTLLGGSLDDGAAALALDAQGNTYVAGTTRPPFGPSTVLPNDFPSTPGAYHFSDTGGFVAKLDPSGANLLYSARYGSADTFFNVFGLAVDAAGSSYVIGGTTTPVADRVANALQALPAGFESAYLLRFDPTGSSLLYGTYLGGSGSQRPQTIALDNNNSAYLGGYTDSADFPVTAGSLRSTRPGPRSGFLAKIDFSVTCSFSIDTSSANAPAEGVSGAIHLTTGPACSWIASSSASWLTVSTVTGTGSATVAYKAASNYTFQSRTATLTVAGQTFTVTQPPLTGCTPDFTISPSSFTAQGGLGTIQLNPGLHCPWNVSSDSPWLTVSGSGSNTGSASLLLQAAPNNGARRTATLTLYDRTYQVAQAAAGCSISLSLPATISSSGGNLTLSIVPSSPACDWGIASTSTALTVMSYITGGTGTASPVLSVSPNQTSRPRTLTVYVDGQAASVTQAGTPCTFAFPSTPAAYSAGATVGTVTLSASAFDCSWSGGSGVPWLILDQSSGTGPANIPYHLLANPTSAPRTGTLGIGGQTFTVTQAAGPAPTPVTLTTTAATPLYNTNSSFTRSPAGAGAMMTRTITLTASTPGTPFTTNLVGLPSSVLVSPSSGVTPADITISIFPGSPQFSGAINFAAGGAIATYTLSLNAPVAVSGFGSEAGIYRNGLLLLDQNGDGTCCAGDLVGALGQAGDIPLSGDWNGYGVKKFGLYRPSTGLFLLDVNGNGAFDSGIDSALTFAPQAGDIPVVGTWINDGTNRDRVGIFRPSTGTWYLDTNGDGSFTGRAYLGQTGDIPVVGDWNWTGSSKVGIYRPASVNGQPGNFFLVDSNGDGRYTSADAPLFFLGQSGDIPIVGDWSGDGKSKVGIFRPSNGLFILDQNGSFSWDGPATDRVQYFQPYLNGLNNITTIQAGDVPITGNWVSSYAPPNANLLNGNGRSRTGIFRPSTGTFFLDSTADGTFQGRAYIGQPGDVPVGSPVIFNGSIVGVNGLGGY